MILSEKPKGRAASKAYHHQKIIDATIDCIASYGFAGTTVTKLATASGLSRGMVNLHFASKEQLLLAVLKHLTDEYRESWKEALKAASDTPMAKLNAIIKSDFDLVLIDQKKASVWLTYRVEALTRPEYLAYCDNRDRELFETIESLCLKIGAAGNYQVSAKSTTMGLMAISEGSWVDFLLHPDDFDRVQAVENCLTFLRGAYPNHF